MNVMKDSELRGLVLQWFYNNRRGELACPNAAEIHSTITDADVLAICDQLSEHCLIDWKPIRHGGRTLRGYGKISANGIDVVEEEGRAASLSIQLPIMQNFTFNSPSNVQVGNNNTQQIEQVFHGIIDKINASSASDQEKQEAKHRLKSFLEHPLVTSIVGGIAGGLVGLAK